ncbi:MAG: hypothetical protein OXC40_04170 [Proteobacteria bacterium]|nr:hypothetical protein [Pseudomonadota bacterium]
MPHFNISTSADVADILSLLGHSDPCIQVTQSTDQYSSKDGNTYVSKCYQETKPLYLSMM